MRTWRALATVVVAAGCGEEAGGGAPVASLSPVAWEASTGAWDVDPKPLTAVAEFDGHVLVGQASRLSVLQADSIETIAEVRVRSMVPLSGVGVVIVDDAGALHIWDGAVSESPLAGALDGPAEAITVRRDELWIATDTSIYRWEGGDLTHIAHGGGVIQGLRGADRLVAGDTLLTPSETGIEVVDLGVPGFVVSTGVLGLFEGRLWQRSDDQWALVGLSDVTDLVVDPAGIAYARRADEVVRLDADGAWSTAVAEDWAVSDSGLWWGASTGRLERLGAPLTFKPRPEVDPDPDPEAAPTYVDTVAAFSEASCDRCHRPLGIARDLTNYEDWVANVDRAITEIEAGRMPQDGGLLVGGDADMLKRWKDGGLSE